MGTPEGDMRGDPGADSEGKDWVGFVWLGGTGEFEGALELWRDVQTLPELSWLRMRTLSFSAVVTSETKKSSRARGYSVWSDAIKSFMRTSTSKIPPVSLRIAETTGRCFEGYSDALAYDVIRNPAPRRTVMTNPSEG